MNDINTICCKNCEHYHRIMMDSDCSKCISLEPKYQFFKFNDYYRR